MLKGKSHLYHMNSAITWIHIFIDPILLKIIYMYNYI